ncbi:ATP-binding protein [Streptomyces mangrovisoli]|uniref:NB-ARC domain-containing protein n=1 Tax=Streptomyces mangrovisoli TaxID=1428628 RepID=A0A1J4P0J6_9ACTN|nr:hypothetical protein [Streptomyces mangrovisoli]OIJ68120.1 hypothetical protein WN71_010040 [Streptomyces mangrovisoli]
MRSNLPEVPAGFVGRPTELGHLADALRLHRLVTLTGPGGVGKSRLALQAAGELRARGGGGGGTPAAGGADHGRERDGAGHGREPGGADSTGAADGAESLGAADGPGRRRDVVVTWVDLWPLPDDRLLIATVADALDFADHTAADPLDALAVWLADKDVLIVLDSCEHLVPACRVLVDRLLDACPGVTVLATSREPLGLSDEHRVAVEPLSTGGEAVQLLGRLAAEAGRPLTGTPDMIVASRLCHRLEGIPLAVELIAGHLHEHTIDEMDRQLASRLDLAAAGPRPGPPRHQALRTTIGWSHELCGPAERLLWARMSVFRGPVDTYTLHAVCPSGPLRPDDVPSALHRLERQSVITQRTGLYRMLDTVRDYGRMWLRELGEEGPCADRHAAYYLDMARRADTGWLGPDQIRWYRWLGTVHADLCAALDHLLDTRPHEAVELSGRLAFFWSCCGHLQEAAHYLEESLALSGEPGPARGRAMWALGVVRVLRGEAVQAKVLADACRRDAELREDTDGLLRAAYLTGLAHLLDGKPVAATDAVDLALKNAGGLLAFSAAPVLCRLVRIFALTARGEWGPARQEAEALRENCAARGEWWTRSYTDYQLALIALLEDRADRATAHALSMLEGKRRIGDTFGLALGLDVLAFSLVADGVGERGVAAFAAGESYWGAVGHPQRGTPELAPLRDRYQNEARALVGADHYDELSVRARFRGPEAVLAELLGPVPPGQ